MNCSWGLFSQELLSCRLPPPLKGTRCLCLSIRSPTSTMTSVTGTRTFAPPWAITSRRRSALPSTRMAPPPTAAALPQHTARSRRLLVKCQQSPPSSRLLRPTVLECPSSLEGLTSAGRQPRLMIMAIPTGKSGAASNLGHMLCFKYGDPVIRGVEGDPSTVSDVSPLLSVWNSRSYESHWSLAWAIHCSGISRNKEVLVTLAATGLGNILILSRSLGAHSVSA